MALLLKANGQVEQVTPANGSTWSLKELQAFVGGYIEIAHPRLRVCEIVEALGEKFIIADFDESKDMILVVNEEGLLKELPFNEKASLLYTTSPLVGDVLYCWSKEVE